MDCDGKVALVTGSAKRVGRAIAIELARAGLDVAIHYRKSEAEAQKTVAEIKRLGRRAVAVPGDLTQPNAPAAIVAQTADQLGPVAVLANNASIFERHALDDADADAWQRTLQINLIAPALLARATAPAMRAAGDGCIINLIDILADRPVKNFGPYCASKAALANLTKMLALELAPEVRVNGIAPGIAEFPSTYDETFRRQLTARVPLQRTGSPEDIARLTRFLVTEGDYITGQIIAVDGGWSSRSV